MFRSEGSELVKGSMLALTIEAILDFAGERSGKFLNDQARTSSGGGERRRRDGPARWAGRESRAGSGSGTLGEAAEGRVLQRGAAGHLVRPGQAGGRMVGQAVQRRGHLVRRPA